jgi:hypothetical protein
MKRTAAILSFSLALAGLAAFGISRAGTVEQPPLPSSYSAAALYDLGNFYARMGRPALAVLNYERARVFAPNDPDIRANLRHVRESAGTPTPSGGWLARHDRWANPNTLYWTGLSGLALAGTSLLLRRSKAGHRAVSRRGAALGVALGVTLTALALGDAFATASTLQESVVMFATPAGASPISGAEPLFTVPLADVVEVRDEHGGFELIVDSQGRQGWVASHDLEPVIPRSESLHGFRKVIRRFVM